MATQCKQLCDLLAAEGVSVELIQTNVPYRPAWIGTVRGVRALFRLAPYVAELARKIADRDVVHIFANSGWAWHLYAAPAVWIARWKGIPVIVNYRGGDCERFLRSAPRWVRKTLLSADACVAPSGFICEVLGRFEIAAEIIPNVIDLSLFRPSETARERSGPHLIVTRNLEPIYGIDVVLRAFACVCERYPDARLTIAGEGPERPQLERLAEALHLEDRVRFAGRLSRDGIAELYRDADVMVNASLVDNMPNSILEAFASGLPVVSSATGGIPFLARDEETALLVPLCEPDSLAQAVCRVLDDRELAARLASNGLREARRYSWPVVRSLWIDLYRALVARKHALPARR
jgi:glycosyltransferase involved in cell wall biosynthesis